MSNSPGRHVTGMDSTGGGSSRGAPVAGRYVSVRIGETATVRSGDILAQPIDIDAQMRGISNAVHIKGLLVNRITDYVNAVRPEAYPQYIELHPGRVPALHDSPARDLVRCTYDAACLSHPDVPVAEGLRRLGWSGYESFLGSLFGKMLFAALGKDIETIYRFGPRAFALLGNTVRVVRTRMGDKRCRYDYDPCFSWLDSYQIGVIEGTARMCGFSTEAEVHLEGRYRGWIEWRWF